ncbi:nuclear protein [Kwoniella heveanensis CBS 569]|nr:nuclear protein [Kwoniella heveanensis CBS 569]
MSSEAGPSRSRQYNGHDRDRSRTQSHTQKRRKVTDVKEIFEKPNMEEQVRLSKEYRALQADADEMRANMANATAEDLTRAIGKQSELFLSVKDTGIGTLDANLLKTNTENAMALAKRLKIDGVAFDLDEFLIQVQNQLGLDRAELADQDLSSDDELEESDQKQFARKGALGDWERVGWMAARLYRRIPGVEFMYGPLSATRKKRKQAQRQKKQALAPEVRPEEVKSQGEKKVKDDFTSNVRMVNKVLNTLDPEGEGINFFHLVVNPDDYGQTVENCFFVSFLLNQGKAGIFVTDDGEVMIREFRMIRLPLPPERAAAPTREVCGPG